MECVLDTKVFFFDAKMDYLAYYKSYDIEIDDSKNVFDLLKAVKVKEPSFEFDEIDTALKIDSKALFAKDVKIADIVKDFGNSITIEPLSTLRSVKDLKIDSSDFLQKYDLLKEFCDDEDFEIYKKMICYYYASETLQYNRDYYGDSLFVFAHYLIKKNPSQKQDILRVIADERDGIWLYEKACNLYPKSDFFEKIVELKNMIIELIPGENSVIKNESKLKENYFNPKNNPIFQGNFYA